MAHIIVPNRYVNLKTPRFVGEAVYFLAGPLIGGGEWQHLMCTKIIERDTRAVIVVPNRWDDAHPLGQYFLPDECQGSFHRQKAYERHYMALAAQGHYRGCLVFWVSKQVDPRPEKFGPYARDTYGEIGRWIRDTKYNPNNRIVIGGEADHPSLGLDQIKFDAERDLERCITIYTSITETAKAAVSKA